MTAQTDADLALKRLISRDNKHLQAMRDRRKAPKPQPAPAPNPNETVQQYMKRLRGEA
jgi:hypothetical protein